MTTLLGNQLSDYDIQFSIDLRLVGSFCFKGMTRHFRGTSLSTQLQMSTGELSVKSDEFFLGGERGVNPHWSGNPSMGRSHNTLSRSKPQIPEKTRTTKLECTFDCKMQGELPPTDK